MFAASSRRYYRTGWTMLSSIDPKTLARLRVVVEAGKPVPPDLAWAVLVALESTADREERVRGRDSHIRRASLLIDGTPWHRACVLATEAGVIDRIWEQLRFTRPDPMTVRGELHAARLLHKLPGSARQFKNIIPR